MRLGSVLFLLLALGCSTAPVLMRDRGGRIYSVPVIEADGTKRLLQTRVCPPKIEGPARVVVINHGSPPDASDRPGVDGFSCASEPAAWFLARGYLVVSPVRRGYGATGGKWSEGFGSCNHPDFVKAGLETARDIAAAVEFATGLPNALPDGAVVVGQSAGGWGTIAYNSVAHPKVGALINMAGGRGGHHQSRANHNCDPKSLAEAAGQFGKTAGTPMLWMYTANDSFFDPLIAQALHSAFTNAGGRAELVQTGPFEKDGHREFTARGGSQVWGPVFDRYFAERFRDAPKEF